MKVRPCRLRIATGGRPGAWKDSAPLPRRAGRIVQRPNEPAFAFEQLYDLLLVPEMIAGGDDVHARLKDFLRRGRP